MTSDSAAFFLDALAIRPIQDFEISTAAVNSNSRCRAARSRHCAMSIMPFETSAAVAAAITTELNNSLLIIVLPLPHRQFGAVHANELLTFARTSCPRLGFRYRIVDSMSLCPIQFCTVRRSTSRLRRCVVAKVARNLCNQQLSGFKPARFATAFRQSRKSSFGLHPAVGNTRLHVLSDFPFHLFRLATSLSGIGISRSRYAFGVQPRSGLWLTFTVA